jgi:hypothetical protein
MSLMKILPVLLTALTFMRAEAPNASTLVLRPSAFRRYVDAFNRNDVETTVNHVDNKAAWAWLEQNIPFFESSDKDLEEIYNSGGGHSGSTLRRHPKASSSPSSFRMSHGPANTIQSVALRRIISMKGAGCAIGNILRITRTSGSAGAGNRAGTVFGPRTRFVRGRW